MADEVTGIELIKMDNSGQDSPLIDKMLIGNVEIMELHLQLNYFDVILCGDVLEHLVDPWRIMKNMRQYLKPKGVIIISVPNIREIKTLFSILFKADFSYQEKGVLDKTHLRFFCKRNILSLLSGAFFEPVKICSSLETMELMNARRVLNKLTFGFFKDLLTAQYIIVARKSEKRRGECAGKIEI